MLSRYTTAVREARAATAALAFLTRVPVPLLPEAADVARAGAYFPLVGAGLGGLEGLAARRVNGVAAVALGTLMTGALHLDALADCADGLGVSRDRALEVMADSRIGSFGATALWLDLTLKARALEEMPLGRAVLAGALSRAVPVMLAAALPYVRPGGSAQAFSLNSRARAGVAFAGAVLLARDLEAGVVTGTFALASALFWWRRLGGITGDVLGASIELCQTLLLLTGTPSPPSRASAASRGPASFRGPAAPARQRR